MSQLVEQEDEVDLAEAVATVSRNIWIVLLSSIFVAFVSGYWAFFQATPEYSATARFEFDESNRNNNGLGSLSGIAELAGFVSNPGSSEAQKLRDRILTTSFVERIYFKAELAEDPLFNSHFAPPSFTAQIKSLLFGPVEFVEPSFEDLLLAAVNILTERMTLEISANQIMTVSIQHPKADQAARIANAIVNEAFEVLSERKQKQARATLNYFSGRLLDVRSELDRAKLALSEYGIENNLQPNEELIRTSAQLAQQRRSFEEVSVFLEALQKLTETSYDDFDGFQFSLSFPFTSGLDFRRKMGWEPSVDSWYLPDQAVLMSAIDYFEEQRGALQANIDSLTERALVASGEVLRLSGLEREVQVQTTLYEGLASTFEQRSLLQGFQPEIGGFLEQARPPKFAAHPRKLFSVVAGGGFGLFLGVVLAFVVSALRGTLHSASRIHRKFSGFQYYFLRKKHLPVSGKALTKTQRSEFADLVALTPSNARMHALIGTDNSAMVRRLATAMLTGYESTNKKAAILDLSNNSVQLLISQKPGSNESNNSYVKLKSRELHNPEYGNIDEASLDKLKKDFDVVFICLPIPKDGLAVSVSTIPFVENVVVLAGRSKATLNAISSIKKILEKAAMTEPLLVVV